MTWRGVTSTYQYPGTNITALVCTPPVQTCAFLQQSNWASHTQLLTGFGAPLRFAIHATLSLEARVFHPQDDPPWLSLVHTRLEVSMADMPHITDIMYLAPKNSVSICAVWRLQANGGCFCFNVYPKMHMHPQCSHGLGHPQFLTAQLTVVLGISWEYTSAHWH